MYKQPKTYLECMNEISADDLYEGLLGYGMFTEKLPQIFTSVPFYEFCKSKKRKPSFKKGVHKWISFDVMRNTSVPRTMGIPNPFAYHYLCKELSDNWADIRKHFADKTWFLSDKISRIHIRKKRNSKSLFEMNYDSWKVDGDPVPYWKIGNKYVVKADISSCFPSIYTHALSWALIGKTAAKQCRNDKGKLCNKLDQACRTVKDGETHGLLIGPHASNLLSEIILTAVDDYLQNDSNLGEADFLRYIDDYQCYVSNQAEGEFFLQRLNQALKKFDLSLNHKKTKIEKLPEADINAWPEMLKTQALLLLPQVPKVSSESEKVESLKPELSYNTVKAYLDYAVSLMCTLSNDGATLSYAVKVLSNDRYIMSYGARSYFGKTMMHLAGIYPYLLRLLERYVFTQYEMGKKRLSDKILADAMRINNFEAAYYALYFALKYNFPLDGINYQWILCSDDCILKLLGWLYAKKYSDEETVELFHAEALQEAQDQDETDRNWLFVYELLSLCDMNNIANKENTWINDWKAIKEAGVTFLKNKFSFNEEKDSETH